MRANIQLAVIVLAPTMAPADGLLYQLPNDGSWVQFKMNATSGSKNDQREITGTLKMSSVGTSEENGEKCRWIEIQMTMNVGGQERAIVAKVLIPEKDLKRGKSPFDNRVRGWIRMGADRDPVKIDESNIGPLPGFLCGPLQDAKKLEPMIVESKLGKLKCEGTTGTVTFKERQNNNTVKYETRLHEKAPFGVVWTSLNVKVERDGEVREEVKMELTLSEHGMGAKSELPDNQ